VYRVEINVEMRNLLFILPLRDLFRSLHYI
jgi:hypothetical protein